MLSPGRILETPRQVAVATSASARSASIEVIESQSMSAVKLIVHLSEIFIEVKRGRNITLPSRITIWEDSIRIRDIGVDYLPSYRVDTICTNYVRHAVTYKRCVGGGVGWFGCRRRKVSGAFECGRNPSTV